MYPLKDIEKYDENNLDNLSHRYTTVYLWNYLKDDRREYVWSHPWVDIVPIKPNQEVYSILDWVVDKVWDDGAYGKFINIKHTNVIDFDDFSKKTTIISCYLHLSNTKVEIWDIVKEWDLIWYTWNTWMSYWEHLHFQIDKKEAPYSAYWPYSWAEIKEAWITFLEWVNKWLWLEKAKKLTINPLVYLNNIENLKLTNDTTDKKEEIKLDTSKKIETETSTQTPKIEKEEIIPDIKKPKEQSKTTDESDVDKWLASLQNKKETSSDKKETTFTKIAVEEVVKEKPTIIKDNSETLLASLWWLPTTDVNSSTTWVSSQTKQSFKDIPKTDELYDFLNTLYDKWIIKWYSDRTFRPNNPITRAEFLKVVFEITNTTLSNDTKNYFSDINNNMWHKSYVNTWVNLWLISTKNNLFRPNSYITRVEALKIIITLISWDIKNKYTKNFVDINPNEWYAPFVEYSVSKNLIPITNNHFYPNKNITRREVIQALYKIS